MSLPEPEPGLVFSYPYLWRHGHNKGLDEGRRDRSSIIVLNAKNRKDGTVRVTVVAITHRSPTDDAVAIEIPPKVKQHLKLDDERSWVIIDEVNQFDWPGYDVRPLPGKKGKFAYGFIPPKLYESIKTTLLDANTQRRLYIIPRD